MEAEKQVYEAALWAPTDVIMTGAVLASALGRDGRAVLRLAYDREMLPELKLRLTCMWM